MKPVPITAIFSIFLLLVLAFKWFPQRSTRLQLRTSAWPIPRKLLRAPRRWRPGIRARPWCRPGLPFSPGWLQPPPRRGWRTPQKTLQDAPARRESTGQPRPKAHLVLVLKAVADPQLHNIGVGKDPHGARPNCRGFRRREFAVHVRCRWPPSTPRESPALRWKIEAINSRYP